MKAAYYIRDEKPDGSRNSWCITVLVDVANWPSRNRDHKGATAGRYRFCRTMSEDEAKKTSYKYRLTFWRYQTWQELIEDEERILGKDHAFINRLREEAKKTKNIPFSPIGKQTELF